MRLVLEPAEAVAVERDVETGVADGLRRGRPDLAGSFIPDVHRLAGRVDDRIVRPGRELVLTAVLGPGVAATVRGNLEAEVRIRNHVDPGRRRRPARGKDCHVL